MLYNKEVTVVMSSFDRLDLMRQTVDSFLRMNSYPIKEFIIVEDSCNKEMHEEMRGLFPNFTLIFNEKNLGAFESTDLAYSRVSTPYIFQTEEDWIYHRPGFIENSMKVLEADPRICLVWIRDMDYLQDHPVLPEVHYADGQPYQILGSGEYWHGWSGAPGLRRLSDYKLVAPYAQWSKPTDPLSVRECMIDNAFHRAGFVSALLPEGYITHIGGERSTRNG